MPKWWAQWLDLASQQITGTGYLSERDARTMFEEMAKRAEGRCAWVRLLCDGRVVDEWRAAAEREAA